MTRIKPHDDIFTIRMPGKKEGDIIEILDVNNTPRRARLTIPIGDEFTFEWVATPASGSTEGIFAKIDEEWLIKTSKPHMQGDRILVAIKDGEPQEHILGECVGENLFKPKKRNHFVKNPTGGEPKWCVRVYDEAVKVGEIVDVLKTDKTTQKVRLVSMVEPGIWTSGPIQ